MCVRVVSFLLLNPPSELVYERHIVTHTSTRGRHAAPARTPMAVLSKAASSPANRRGALVFASSGLIITMAATTASASTDTTVEATPVAGEATVSDDAVAALALAPSVVAPEDAEFASVDLDASSEPAPVVVQVARTVERTAPAAASSTSTSSSGAAAQTQSSTPAPPSTAGGVVGIARQYVGTPYVFGGASPSGFDCSGFTQYVFRQIGVNLPRSSAAQRNAGTIVSASEAQPGDLVWWPGHIGIYTGNGNHIAARNPGTALHETRNPASIN